MSARTMPPPCIRKYKRGRESTSSQTVKELFFRFCFIRNRRGDHWSPAEITLFSSVFSKNQSIYHNLASCLFVVFRALNKRPYMINRQFAFFWHAERTHRKMRPFRLSKNSFFASVSLEIVGAIIDRPLKLPSFLRYFSKIRVFIII